MALGTFTVTIDADQLGAGTETSAALRVQFGSGRQFIKDEAAGKFVFPHVSNSKPVAISLPYALELETDVTTGESASIGYVVTVTTASGGRVVAGPFAARAANTTIALTDPSITSDFEGLVPESLAVRAETAAADAEAAKVAAEAVGSTNDTIIAGRINDPASATATALSATYASPGQVRSKVKTDGTDQSSVLQGEINSLMAGGGGTLVLPAGTVRIDSRIVLPNNGPSASQTQATLRLTGQGGYFAGAGLAAANTGTMLDLRYSGGGSNLSKIYTSGYGLLVLDNLTLTDKGTSSNPFLYSTFTTILAHDMAVTGNPSKGDLTCDQDAFVLGGTVAQVTGGTNDGFQGYGTVIERVFFQRIRRAVHGRAWLNGVVIQNNMVGHNCGGGAAYAPIEIDSGTSSGAFCRGNIVRGNLMELHSYGYGVILRNSSTQNSIQDNGFWDQSGIWVASVGCMDNAVSGNYVVLSGEAGTIYESNPGANVVMRPHASGGPKMGGSWTWEATNSGTTPFTVKANTGGQAADIFSVKKGDGTQTWRFDANGAFRCGTGLGATLPIEIINNTAANPAAVFRNQGFDTGVKLGEGAPVILTSGNGTERARILFGAGSPEGVKTAVAGSLYLNYSGGAGTTFWVKESGTGNTGWVAK